MTDRNATFYLQTPCRKPSSKGKDGEHRHLIKAGMSLKFCQSEKSIENRIFRFFSLTPPLNVHLAGIYLRKKRKDMEK